MTMSAICSTVVGPGDALDEARLARADDVAAARRSGCSVRRARDDVVEREPVLGELRRVGLGLELLLEASPGVDFRDARHAPEPRPDDPILERPKLGQVDSRGSRS